MRGENKINWYLILKDMPRKELAANAGISHAELSRIIQKQVSPKFNTMVLIANSLKEDIRNVFYDGKQGFEYENYCFKGDMELKNKIKDLLAEKKMTMRELSEKAGVSTVQILKIIRNQVSPTFETMILIADALEEDVWDIFY